MISQATLQSLRDYSDFWFGQLGNQWGEDKSIPSRFATLIAEHSDHLERTCIPGHFTASALILTPDSNPKVLLTLHRKLGKWLQLGGHCDGEADTRLVAMKEAEEESGLVHLSFAPGPSIVDLDIHRIPARPKEPEHLHYDFRYVILADEKEKLKISEESVDLKWFNLEDARRITHEPSLHRLFEKAYWIRSVRGASQGAPVEGQVATDVSSMTMRLKGWSERHSNR